MSQKPNAHVEAYKLILIDFKQAGGGGAFRENSLKNDFIVALDRGGRYLSAAFDAMEEYCS